MFRTRKEPRLNLRFPDHDELDELELLANKKGMTLAAFIKFMLRNALKNDQKVEDFRETTLESLLIVRGVVEDTASEDQVSKAKARVKSYLAKLGSNADR